MSHDGHCVVGEKIVWAHRVAECSWCGGKRRLDGADIG